MAFTRGESVEFLASVSCRVLAASGGGVKEGRYTVGRGMVGSVYPSEKAWPCLPGHVIVVVSDEGRDKNIAVEVAEGCIAAMTIENDPRTGLPARRVYRNTVVDIDTESMI